jgi:hypothetical protein
MGPDSSPPVFGGPIYHGKPDAPVDNRQTAQAPTHVGRSGRSSPYPKGKTTRKTGKQVKDVDSHEGGSGGGGGRSDIRLKHDIVELARLKNGIHLYRFRYKWADQQYVGVIAQEVRKVVPGAVSTGADGYLRVDYGKLGLRLETWDEWVREHARQAAKHGPR